MRVVLLAGCRLSWFRLWYPAEFLQNLEFLSFPIQYVRMSMDSVWPSGLAVPDLCTVDDTGGYQQHGAYWYKKASDCCQCSLASSNSCCTIRPLARRPSSAVGHAIQLTSIAHPFHQVSLGTSSNSCRSNMFKLSWCQRYCMAGCCWSWVQAVYDWHGLKWTKWEHHETSISIMGMFLIPDVSWYYNYTSGMKNMPAVPTVPTCSYWVKIWKPRRRCCWFPLVFLHVKCVGMREWMHIYILL
jgi:hypothetical protein